MQLCRILSSIHRPFLLISDTNSVAIDLLLSDAPVTKLMNVITCSLYVLQLSTFVILLVVLNNGSCGTLFIFGCIDHQ